MKPKTLQITTTSTNGYSSDSSSSSSPRRLSHNPHSRRRPRSNHLQTQRDNNNFFFRLLLRRNCRLFLILPLFYILGLLMCVGSFSGIVAPRPLPGSVYRSPEIFYKLWNDIQFDNAFGIELSSIWTYNRRRKEQKPCATTIRRKLSGSSSPTGYLIVEANGGLNQQRSSICNAVALAGLLNAVLVIPRFSFHSVWKDPRWVTVLYFSNYRLDYDHCCQIVNRKACMTLPLIDWDKPPIFDECSEEVVILKFIDPFWEEFEDRLILRSCEVITIIFFALRSGFGDIYDENHFITTLEGYVTVVREIPEALMGRYNYNISKVPITGVKAWAPVSYYMGEVYPILHEHGIIRIAPFANRLANKVPPDIQLLRCLANYKALKFSDPIGALAKELVNRMIGKSSRAGGKYVSVHLRFEEDMVAFSCCVYDGGETEKLDMVSARENGWNKFKSKDRIIQPGLNRIKGNCPLTPLEHRKFVTTLRLNNWMVLCGMCCWKAFKKQMKLMLAENDREGFVVPRDRTVDKRSSIYAHPTQECRCLRESPNSTFRLDPTAHNLNTALENKR
ncbi:hypothetical protein GIB67_005134 [Kingdonia uniflora]|uniref:O-fucosyltransferase family protein n=1 Tax=Kingdonia uniflora TaxID=39325 RepID=A0A7J7LA22_9MAGN|nr:hypothetical protein GIB67_005134 [Kingdonia uniflora]